MKPNSMAIDLSKDKRRFLNSANSKVAQSRKRFFMGEVIKTGVFPEIEKYQDKEEISIAGIFKDFPSPFKEIPEIPDPNYSSLKIPKGCLTDHFYDTGIYQCLREEAKYAKQNHPYMGKMFFPENISKPSRTVTATKLSNSWEALIYNSEKKREGNGKYRTPTIREIAVLMSFPITYQFVGLENTKWRLIGNAVCPLISGAIERATSVALGVTVKKPKVVTKINVSEIEDLNNQAKKDFGNPPKRDKGSRF